MIFLSVAEINVNDLHDGNWWDGMDLWNIAIKASVVTRFFCTQGM